MVSLRGRPSEVSNMSSKFPGNGRTHPCARHFRSQQSKDVLLLTDWEPVHSEGGPQVILQLSIPFRSPIPSTSESISLTR